jgi:WD40 repeat protein
MPLLLPARDMAVSADGKLLAAACGSGSVWVWHIASGHAVARLPQGNALGPLAFSPDGAVLAALVDGVGATVVLWDIHARRQRGQVGVRLPVFFAFSADGNTLITCEGHDTLLVHDFTGLQQTALCLPVGDQVLAMALSPCGRILGLGMDSGEVRLWPAELLRLQE